MKQANSSRPRMPNAVIAALADTFNRNMVTIQRWIDRNDDRLTSAKAIKVLEEHGVLQDVIGANQQGDVK